MVGQQMLVDTDYPSDKISWFDSGSIVVPASSSSFPTKVHGLTYTPLATLKWSTDPNFANSYDELGISTIDNVALAIQTDVSTTYFFALNNLGSAVTIYWRIYYQMPSDVNVVATATAGSLDKFQKNTDYNYTKLFLDSVATGSGATVNHGLGYYPQVEVWYVRTDGKCIHLLTNEIYASPFNPTAKLSVFSLVLAANSVSVSKWYYKVYLDAA